MINQQGSLSTPSLPLRWLGPDSQIIVWSIGGEMTTWSNNFDSIVILALIRAWSERTTKRPLGSATWLYIRVSPCGGEWGSEKDQLRQRSLVHGVTLRCRDAGPFCWGRVSVVVVHDNTWYLVLLLLILGTWYSTFVAWFLVLGTWWLMLSTFSTFFMGEGHCCGARHCWKVECQGVFWRMNHVAEFVI